MTHKLATWIDQFGTSGCVGCGRCITWCPVGIDITEEAAAIRANAAAAEGRASWKTLERILQRASVLRRLAPAEYCQLVCRLRPQSSASMPGEYLFHEGEPANEFFLIRHGRVALEIDGARAAPIIFQTLARARSSAPPGSCRPIAGCSTRAPRVDARHRHRRRLSARQMRGGPRSRLRDDEALSAGAGKAAARDAAADPRCLRRSTEMSDRRGIPIRWCRSSIGSTACAASCRHLDARARHRSAGRGRRLRRGSSTCSMPSASAKWRSA